MAVGHAERGVTGGRACRSTIGKWKYMQLNFKNAALATVCTAVTHIEGSKIIVRSVYLTVIGSVRPYQSNAPSPILFLFGTKTPFPSPSGKFAQSQQMVGIYQIIQSESRYLPDIVQESKHHLTFPLPRPDQTTKVY
jgi:hypothetical protein